MIFLTDPQNRLNTDQVDEDIYCGTSSYDGAMFWAKHSQIKEITIYERSKLNGSHRLEMGFMVVNTEEGEKVVEFSDLVKFELP